MKIILSKIVNSKDALQSLLKEKLPVRISYGIQKTFRLIEKELNDYEEMRSKLIMEKYGEQQEDGNWKVMPDKMSGFVHELSELLTLEVELDFKKVKLPETLSMTPSDCYMLDWFIEIDEEES